MKIAVIGTIGIPYPGGVEKHVEELYSRLAKKGFDITIYCRKGCIRDSGDYKGMKRRVLPTFRNKHLEAFVHSFLASLDLLFKDYDVVHYHAMGPSLFCFLPRIFKKKVVVTFHGLDWKREKWGAFSKIILKLGEYTALRFSHKVIVVSKTMQKYYKNKFYRDTFYISNGIDALNDKDFFPTRSLKEKFNLEKNSYILFVSKLSPEKGAHFLISAFKQLKTDLKLVIAGGSRHSDKYITRLKEESINNSKIIFTDLVVGDELKQLYSDAYLFVQPSTIEGMAFTMLEAMNFSKCILCSDIDENKAVVDTCGITFKNKNIQDLKNKIQFLLQQPTLVAELGQKARYRVCIEYNWEHVINEMAKLLNGFLDKRNV